MFTVSTKGIYGLTAMLELAARFNSGPMQIKDIASAHKLPGPYLEQVMIIMKKAGLVKSLRGTRGGYVLARPAAGIKLLDILESLEGRIEVVKDKARKAKLKFLWGDLESGIRELLEMSLEDVLLRKNTAEKQINYSI